tara:strand:- start:237 stop:506 length:270 start_codon:yes stop_codon:yes gene_type:complete
MNKLIPLILLTALVGCAEGEYESLIECKMKERQKLKGNVVELDVQNIAEYCGSFVPEECNPAQMTFDGKITYQEYLDWEYPKICDRWGR